MASIAGMAWEAARRAFLAGYDAFQTSGPLAQCPWGMPGDKRIGLFVAGKDAAKKRIAREKAWGAFRTREETVM